MPGQEKSPAEEEMEDGLGGGGVGAEERCEKEEEIRKDETMRKEGEHYRVVNDASSGI